MTVPESPSALGTGLEVRRWDGAGAGPEPPSPRCHPGGGSQPLVVCPEVGFQQDGCVELREGGSDALHPPYPPRSLPPALTAIRMVYPSFPKDYFPFD